jgi:hypothetical protein
VKLSLDSSFASEPRGAKVDASDVADDMAAEPSSRGCREAAEHAGPSKRRRSRGGGGVWWRESCRVERSIHPRGSEVVCDQARGGSRPHAGMCARGRRRKAGRVAAAALMVQRGGARGVYLPCVRVRRVLLHVPLPRSSSSTNDDVLWPVVEVFGRHDFPPLFSCASEGKTSRKRFPPAAANARKCALLHSSQSSHHHPQGSETPQGSSSREQEDKHGSPSTTSFHSLPSLQWFFSSPSAWLSACACNI